jgi:hypothetical protein
MDIWAVIGSCRIWRCRYGNACVVPIPPSAMAANFVVVLPETDGLAAMTIAERLRTLFAAVKTPAPSGETILCTVSIGISVCQSGG